MITKPATSQSKIIVALDYADFSSAKKLVDLLSPDLCKLKIGKELFTSVGPQAVEYVVNKGFDVFLDLKFHDIPSTVAKACQAASRLGVWMMNIHALGGQEMMQAAREALDSSSSRPYLIAVTILTSHNEESLNAIGLTGSVITHVEAMARLAVASGLDGVVCSTQESAGLRRVMAEDFLLVTPGIRPVQSDLNDQKRVMTPIEAIKHGSDYLVIGRPITEAESPVEILTKINAELIS